MSPVARSSARAAARCGWYIQSAQMRSSMASALAAGSKASSLKSCPSRSGNVGAGERPGRALMSWRTSWSISPLAGSKGREFRAVAHGALNVVLGDAQQPGLLLERERPHHLRRHAEREHAGRNLASLGNERAGSQDRAGADLRAVE